MWPSVYKFFRKAIFPISLTLVLSSCLSAVPIDAPGVDANAGLFQYKTLLQQFPQAQIQNLGASQPSGNITYNVVIDSSVSMDGYVTSSCTDFCNLLDALGQACFQKNVTYQKFGTNLVPYQSGDEFFDQAKMPADKMPSGAKRFYTATGTDILQALQKIDQEDSAQGGRNVYLLISDFILSGSSDALSISEDLYDNYVKKDGKDLCLLGWNVDFNGPLFDIPINNTPNNDRYAPKIKGKRPLFFLLFGDSQGVRELRESLENGIRTHAPSLQTQIFSMGGISEQVSEPSSSVEWDPVMSKYMKIEDPKYTITDYKGDAAFATFIQNSSVYRAYCGVSIQNAVNDNMGTASINTGGVLKFSIPFSYSEADEAWYSSVRWNPWTESDLNFHVYELLPGETTAVDSTRLRLEMDKKKVTVANGAYQVEVPFTVDCSETAMPVDQPVYFSVTLNATPRFSDVDQTGNLQWLNDWTMDSNVIKAGPDILKQVNKTPYIAEIFINNIWNKYVQEQQVTTQALVTPVDCGRVTFGLVLRDKGDPPGITQDELEQYRPEPTTSN